MSDTTDTSVDFSNVSLSDFGKLSPAQKLGFLLTLPIALPVIAVVKFFQLFPKADISEIPKASVNLASDDRYVPPVGNELEYELDACAFGEDYAEQNNRW